MALRTVQTNVSSHWRIEKGFTLMELLVVIAIAGILTALLLAALSRAKAYAHSTTCKNHLHQMGLALQMYVDEHHNKYPYYRGLSDPAYSDAIGADNTGFWSAKLLPYYPLKWTNAAYHCPGYKGAIEGSITDRHGGWSYPIGSYAYNAMGVDRATKWVRTNNLTLGLGGRLSYGSIFQGRTTRATSEGSIRVPSEMFAIGESRWRGERIGGTRDGGVDFMACGIPFVNRGAMSFDPARHGKNYNQLFCDGHVSAMSPAVLFNPTNTASMWNYDHEPHPELWPLMP